MTNAIDEIKRLKKRNSKLKDEIREDGETSEKIILDLKTHVEEAKHIEDVLKDQLKEKESDCEKLKYEIVGKSMTRTN